MQITCKCLNIVIEIKGERYEVIDKALKSILGNHDFFQEEIATVDVSLITKKLPSLVEAHSSGPWVINQCLNCGLYTYAHNEDAVSSTIIVNRAVLTDAKEIAALMESESYSPVFKIVIYQKDTELDTLSELEGLGDHKLYSQLSAWIEEQTALTEEKVQSYTEKQYAVLEELKAKAHRDHLTISRVITAHTKVPVTKNKLPTTPDEDTVARNTKEVKDPVQKPPKITKSEKSSTNGTSFDSEGLFALDDLEGCSNEGMNDEDISDASEGEESVHTQRRYDTSQVARSLPVPVPQFMQDRQHNDSSSGSPQVPTDIAASIKALAKSVHGDTVFGELPRPRFSTHL